MNSIYGYYNGENIVLSSLINLKKNQKVLIMPIDNITDDKYEISLESVDSKYSNTKYIFNEPYKLIIRKEKGNDVPFWYYAEDKDLKIDIMEESLEEALSVFYSEIDMLWRVYAAAEDEKLANDAILLKNNVNKLIRGTMKL